MSDESKQYRLWKQVAFDSTWHTCDTSVLDDIKDSWFSRRAVLQENSQEYAEFLTRLKREHAIETGIVERMYDLSKGITETFIKEGFVQSYLSHGDTNIPENTLMNHLNDHLEAVDFVFDVVRNSRPITVGFIKELHQLVTRHQDSAEGRDQFGNRSKIPLLRGELKIRENNPIRADGVMVLYAPPEHTAAEMDNLVEVFNALVVKEEHPLIIATWFHHAFSTMHPFQDGNGRVARLLTSLIFIKFGYFPFTVLREEAKVRYIKSLEQADAGKPQELVTYFGEVQTRNIQQALNLREVQSTSLEEVQKILIEKIEAFKHKTQQERQAILSTSRAKIFDFCYFVLNGFKNNLHQQVGKNMALEIGSCPFDSKQVNEKTGAPRQDYFYGQIITYAKENNYYFNRKLPKAWFAFRFNLTPERQYQLVFTLHHYGYEDSTLAIGAFLESRDAQVDEMMRNTIILPIPPHVISILNKVEAKEKNIQHFLENAMTIAMAQIASEL